MASQLLLEEPVTVSAKAGKHAKILRVLMSRIACGVYPGKLPGGRELAAEFGTTPNTIFIVLTELKSLGLVRRTERKGTFVTPRGERAKEAPDFSARMVLDPPFDPLGMTDLWASVIFYGFQKVAQERNISAVLDYVDFGTAGEAAVERVLRESKMPRCIGTCLVGAHVQVKLAMRLSEGSGRILLAESYIEEPIVPSLLFDHLDAGRKAAEHLVKLGHRRIAFVHGEPLTDNGKDRLRGAEEFLDRLGMKLSGRLGHRDGLPSGLESLFASPDHPTAVIVERSRSADLLMVLAAKAGVRVPQDLSIVTFGDVRAFHSAPMTFVSMDHEAIGRAALEALLDEDLWAHPRRVLLPVKLVDRGTTSAPPCVAGFAEQGAPPPATT